jgi:hypothetical protein
MCYGTSCESSLVDDQYIRINITQKNQIGFRKSDKFAHKPLVDIYSLYFDKFSAIRNFAMETYMKHDSCFTSVINVMSNENCSLNCW